MSLTLIISTLMAATSPAYQTPILVRGNVNDNIHAIAIAPAPKGTQMLVSTEEGGVRIMDSKTGQTVRTLTPHAQAAYGLAWSKDGTEIATGDETARIFLENANGKKVREYRTHTRGIQKLSFSPDGKFLLSTGKDDELKIYQVNDPKPKEVRKILGAGANFYSGSYNPVNGTTFISGVLDKGARVYDAKSGALKAVLAGHDGQGILDVAYSPSGGRAVSGGKDGTAIVWNLSTGKREGTLKGHEDCIMSVAFSPNGRVIATGSTDRSVRIWDAYTMAQIARLDGQSSVGTPLCFSADGSMLATISDSGGIVFNKVVPAQGSALVPPSSKPVGKPKKAKKRRR